MAENIAGFGLEVTIVATNTFPIGFQITQFVDDTDPLDSPAITIAETALGLNGDQVSWSTATSIPVSLSVIPGSADDTNLALLFEANRVGSGKTGALDDITMIVSYPDDTPTTLLGGTITSGPGVQSVASAGRKKSNTYSFTFENRAGI